MTDRELLELAALAMGMEPFKAWGQTFAKGDGGPPRLKWNPLTDNADCARMEAQLSINTTWIDDYEEEEGPFVICARSPFLRSAPYGPDKQAARRLASTMVAAEIGRRMMEKGK